MTKLSRFNILFAILFILFSLVTFAGLSKHSITDDVITTKITFKIAMDKSISIFKVKISTLNGIVSLYGTVDSVSHAETLIEIAQETDGVIDVNTDHLSIKKSKRPIIDALLTAKVKTQLIKNNVYNNSIHVETKNDIVYLTGTVQNQGEIDTAIKTAKSIRGIKSVDSRLEVKH